MATNVQAPLRVHDLMQTEVITIAPHASVRELAELLTYHRISGMPVVDAGGKVVGVVSATDLVRLAAEQSQSPVWYLPDEDEPKFSGYFVPGRASPQLLRRLSEGLLDGYQVEDIMMPASFSVREDATLSELARFLLDTGVHRALVLTGGRLSGIVTTTDVLRAVAGGAVPKGPNIRPVELRGEW